jgi:two-component system response regulator EvgA
VCKLTGEAENGVDTIQLIREKEPDLIIIDIRIPEMNGTEVLKKIRKLKMEAKTCMLTSYPYPQYKKRYLEAGADYFLCKTDDLKDINIVFAEMLGKADTVDGIQ